MEKNFSGKKNQSNCAWPLLPIVAISRKASPDFARFSPFLISQVFKPNIFEFSKQPNKNRFFKFRFGFKLPKNFGCDFQDQFSKSLSFVSEKLENVFWKVSFPRTILFRQNGRAAKTLSFFDFQFAFSE
jgi:hypothetical protein